MSFGTILQTLLPLFLIVAMLYGVLYFVRKYGINLKGKSAKNINISVVSTQMIAPKKYVSVVKVMDKMLVLGISDNSVNLLKEIDEFIPENIPEPSDDEGFLSMLKKNMGMK